jgi:hypothetical protein
MTITVNAAGTGKPGAWVAQTSGFSRMAARLMGAGASWSAPSLLGGAGRRNTFTASTTRAFFILTGTVKFTSGRDELLATPDTLVTAAIGDPHTFGTVPAGQRSAQHRKDRTVGGSELGSLDVAAQPTELVAENRDLDIFGVLASEAAEHHAGESAGHEVEEGQGRRRIIP